MDICPLFVSVLKLLSRQLMWRSRIAAHDCACIALQIFDLKCSNPSARVSVKLVSEKGVGVIASGERNSVTKCG